MTKIDRTDQELIALLRTNARMPVVEIAKKLGVSRATVQNRMSRLEKEKVIIGYSVVLQPEAESHPVRAVMCVEAGSRREAEVIESLRGNPSITAVHHTTGRWDLIVEISTDSLASFNRIVGEIRLVEGISSTETNLLLDSYK
ncbi:MAG: Lrp/AsnC family transcriptional regulator [Pseudomonadota bacterium]